jgi:CBS domain-containing protein
MAQTQSLTVRDIMTAGAECAKSSDTLRDAAMRMRDLDVGALPVCGDDDRLHGMITDRDIVVSCIAAGGDPASATVGEVTDGRVVTVDADDDVRAALRTMSQNQVRRLPVISNPRLVGIVSQADVARNLPEEYVGELVEAISQE